MIYTFAAKHLDPIKGNNVSIWTRNKDPEHNKKLFKDLIKEINEAGVSLLLKNMYILFS